MRGVTCCLLLVVHLALLSTAAFRLYKSCIPVSKVGLVVLIVYVACVRDQSSGVLGCGMVSIQTTYQRRCREKEFDEFHLTVCDHGTR